MQSAGMMNAVGLMAGTSLDGVDAALIRTDGEGRVQVKGSYTVPYDGPTRAMVIRATKAALEGREEATDITKAADMVTTAHIAAVRALLEATETPRAHIDVIGFHGQTILHRPPLDPGALGRTWQIGAGGVMAFELGIEVVDQFRLADMAAGGEGAPLVPIYHRALAAGLEDRDGPVCVLNLGGVANLTYIPADGPPTEMLAFDCGPANGLIDQWTYQRTGAAMDEGGALAAAGKIDWQAVGLMALHPFVRKKPPKSMDRYDFKLTHVEAMSPADGAATLTAFTAECVARAATQLPSKPTKWIVCGGGRHNPVLMAAIRSRLDGPVFVAEEAGWVGDMVEAECFAFLAVRHLKGLPLTYPNTTHVDRPRTGGRLHRAP